jgi:hypothetical protein
MVPQGLTINGFTSESCSGPRQNLNGLSLCLKLGSGDCGGRGLYFGSLFPFALTFSPSGVSGPPPAVTSGCGLKPYELNDPEDLGRKAGAPRFMTWQWGDQCSKQG